MRMQIKHTSVFLLISMIFLSLTRFAVCNPSTLLIYRDFAHRGDENQVRGVVRAYCNKVEGVRVKEFNLGEEEKLLSYIKTEVRHEEKPLVIAVGEKTVSSFAKMLPLKEATTAHICHMVTYNHSNLAGKANFIALPVHTIGDFEKQVEGTQTKLIKTIGVSHNRQTQEIERIYNKNKQKIPQSDSYLGVILAGDAPTPDNKMLLFTEDNARELARYTAQVLKDRHLLITNGPRTGKHNPNTLEEIKSAHRDGQVDYVTHSFIDELKKSNLTSKQYTLFDFQFTSAPNQDMDLLLGAIRSTHSPVLVAGESTSAISECVDVLYPKSAIAYDNSAMNEVHKAHVKSESEAGRINHLSAGFKNLDLLEYNEENKIERSTATTYSAAGTIATELAK